MLNGIYGYIFGADEDSNDSTTSTHQMNDENCFEQAEQTMAHGQGKIWEDDWFMVDDENANLDRFSPVIVAHPEIRDIDELSFASSHQASTVSSPNVNDEDLRKAEELRLAKAKNAQRAHLEKVMFEDMSLNSLVAGAFQKSTSSKSLKKTGIKATDSLKVGKSRSKKAAGKLSSGRNNDRKVNNID